MVSTSLLAAVATAAASTAPAADAFALSSTASAGSWVVSSSRPLHAMDEASAQAMSDYMAKSHEEKLRAVKDVEEKKNTEIEALKAEIQQLKTTSAPAAASPAAPPPAAAAAPLAPVSASEMESKLASYQSFMAEYIVNAQNQKLLAVKEAELKAEKKFQERLEKLFKANGTSGMPLPGAGAGGEAAAAPAAVAVTEETLFQKRNAQVVASAEAGKSRWGSMEVERAKEMIVADPAAMAMAPPTLFELRNEQVAAAAEAGKSRWGSMEVERAKNGASSPASAEPPAKKDVTLEDRVNLGARLLGK